MCASVLVCQFLCNSGYCIFQTGRVGKSETGTISGAIISVASEAIGAVGEYIIEAV